MKLTDRQWEYLRELRIGPSQWFRDDADARALTRRGLAVYKACATAMKYVITEKGRKALK